MGELAFEADLLRRLYEGPPEPSQEDVEILAEQGERHAPAEHH